MTLIMSHYTLLAVYYTALLLSQPFNFTDANQLCTDMLHNKEFKDKNEAWTAHRFFFFWDESLST